MVDFNQFVTDLTTIGGGTPHMIGYAQNAQSGYIEAPTSAQQQDGVVPLDRLPAQWWNWFLNQATRRFSEAETYIEKAVEELDGILDVMGVSPDSTDQTQLKTMFGSTYLQNYLPQIVESASSFSANNSHSNSLLVTDDDGNGAYSIKKVPYAPPFLVTSQIATAAKTITLPSNCPFDGQSIKVVFTNGHEASNATDYMTLNGVPIVSNQNGTLNYLPIHQITVGTYSVLQSNTALEMYYTATGFSGNPAWVVVCNPVVLAADNYTVFADGKVGDISIGTVEYTYEATAPYGWLFLQGQTLSRTTYKKLFDWADANNYIGSGKPFGTGDGSTTFTLPNLNGEFIRATGINGHANQGSGGTVGQHQDGTEIAGAGVRVFGSNQAIFETKSDSDFVENRDSSRMFEGYQGIYSVGTSSTSTPYVTTRPTNTSLNIKIKAM